MLQDEHFQLLDKLRFGQSFAERKDALVSLKALEDSGLTKEIDIRKLLKDDDLVSRNYAIGAVGRMKIDSLKEELIWKFSVSFDPITLITYLEAFIEFDQPDFLNPVIDKIKVLKNKKKEKGELESAFILDQIILPCLKYIEKHGGLDQEDLVFEFLGNDDANVRWHALKMIENFRLAVPASKLESIAKTDSSRLNQELANILLEKKEQ